MSVALLISALHMSDAEYDAIPAKLRLQQILERAPSWHKPEQVVENIWVWSELVVLLTNRKRRALHDFIAGTVVIKVAAKEPPMISATIPAG
jgi:uncharacterized RDD family membrane protein YckC